MATQLHIFRAQSDTPAFTAKGGILPNRVRIAKWGENANTKGKPFNVGPKTLRVLPALQKARGYEQIALDYMHQSVKRPGHTVPEPLPVAAYGAVEVVAGEGIFLDIDTYTPSGLENAANYKDVSPAVEFDDEGNVIFVHSVGLCRQGSIEDLEFFSADFDAPAEEEPTPKEEPAPDNALMDLVAKLTARLEALEAKLPAAPAAPADAPEVFSAAQGNALVAKIETFATEVAALKDKQARREIVDRALAEGRVRLFSADEEATLDINALRTAYARSPRGVSLTRQTPAHVETFAANPAEDKAGAAARRARAEALQKAKPGKSWAECWDEAK